MPDFTPLKDALQKRSAAEIRVLVLEALQRWRKGPGRSRFELQLHGDLGREIATAVAPAGAVVADFAQAQKEAFINQEAQREPFMRPVMEFIWVLIRAGVLRPSGYDFGSSNALILVTVTDYGLRFLDNLQDHPLSSSFVSKLRTRHPDLPEEVLVLLEDVRACLEAGLLRPAVVLLGVAFESAVERVLDVLESKAIKAAMGFTKLKAAERIDQLRKALDVLDLAGDEKRSAVSAIDYADVLRLRRNDASHTRPKFPFDDLEEVEELVVSGGRHLPPLWTLASATTR